ncbi:MAG: exopolyphosphatase [Chitinophagaceae bacterium]|nr:MAG: exopolyphosphatase [Chitinophagaceae bacterium]
MKLAAIDIGSNGVRILFSYVYMLNDKPVFKKSSLVRVPVRLGEDAFLDGKISKEKTDSLLAAMKAFKLLMEVHKVFNYKACATAALRSAKNGQKIIDQIEKEAGIKVNIIEGHKEAELVFANGVAELLSSKNNYIYIDVGGGSTELSFFSKGKLTQTSTFKIGTLRILNNLVTDKDWAEMKAFIESVNQDKKKLIGIGSGGNINKIIKMFGKGNSTYLSYSLMEYIHEHLNTYTMAERIKILGLNPDRADVIIPATEIFMNIMKWSEMPRIIVPKIGLTDGLIQTLYKEITPD